MAARKRYAPIPTRKPAKRLKRSRSSPGPRTALVVSLLGEPVELVYRHAHDGKLYRHKFGSHARLCTDSDGRHLVIDGIAVKGRFIYG